jgi:cytoplasmic iron level regulating protein YaaA (DUF328/UPF0246 family)
MFILHLEIAKNVTMLLLLSPSKTLDEKFPRPNLPYTLPVFLMQSSALVSILKRFKPDQLAELMSINSKLSVLNAERYQKWELPFPENSAFPAILCFKGEVYNGLKAQSLSENDLKFAQDHLRILSGLYGVLRPFDLMMPYRLEMGTGLKGPKFEDLYQFWGNRITDALVRDTANQVLVNLASDEYFRAVNPSVFKRVVKCHFREERNGKLQFVTIFGKKARGLMARFVIENRISKVEDLKAFDSEGYLFNEPASTKDEWTFSR